MWQMKRKNQSPKKKSAASILVQNGMMGYNYQEVLTWKTEDFLWVVYRGIGEETIAGAQILTYSD